MNAPARLIDPDPLTGDTNSILSTTMLRVTVGGYHPQGHTCDIRPPYNESQLLYRKLRLALYDWNPLLQFLTMLATLALLLFMLWSPTKSPIVEASPPIAPVSPMPVPPGNQSSRPTNVQLAWPWNGCGVPVETINSTQGLAGGDSKSKSTWTG